MKPRENPFASHHIGEMPYRFFAENCDSLLFNLEKANMRGAIIGPHGSGKSTLMRHLQSVMESRGFECMAYEFNIDKEHARIEFDRLHERSILFVDGAEQFSLPFWWLVKLRARAAAGIVLTRHAAGMLPTIWECGSSPEILSTFIAELAWKPDWDFVLELYRRHHGNVRDALREMYDRCAADDFSWVQGYASPLLLAQR